MRFALVALLLASSGCSVALQDRPPTMGVASTCSSGKLWPVIDTVMVVASAAAIAYGAARNDDTGHLIAGPNAVAGIVWLASAGNGYRWSRGCEESKRSSSVARR